MTGQIKMCLRFIQIQLCQKFEAFQKKPYLCKYYESITIFFMLVSVLIIVTIAFDRFQDSFQLFLILIWNFLYNLEFLN